MMTANTDRGGRISPAVDQSAVTAVTGSRYESRSVSHIAYLFNDLQPTHASRSSVMLQCNSPVHATWRFILMELIVSSAVLTVLLLVGAFVDFLVTQRKAV
jgi:hypothetical protein